MSVKYWIMKINTYGFEWAEPKTKSIFAARVVPK